MEVEKSVVIYLANTLYNINPLCNMSIELLCGYDDKNFTIVDSLDMQKYVLKITNETNSDPRLTDIIDEVLDSIYRYTHESSGLSFKVPKLIRTNADRLSSLVDVRMKLNDNDGPNYKNFLCNVKLFEFVQGITLFDYVKNPKINEEILYWKLGEMASDLFVFLRTQIHLISKLKDVRRGFPWQLSTCSEITLELANKLYPDRSHHRRQMIDSVLEEFAGVEDVFRGLPEYILHGDLCGRNIFIGEGGDIVKFTLIDFQDLQVGPKVAEVSMLILYCVLAQKNHDFREALALIPERILRGFQSRNHSHALDKNELLLLPTLVKLRLGFSLLKGLETYQKDPSNGDYVMNTNQRGWTLLELLTSSKEVGRLFGDSFMKLFDNMGGCQ